MLAAPNFGWQAAHGFPQWQVAQAQRHGTSVAQYLGLQLVIVNPVLWPAIVRGARHFWSGACHRYRPLAITGALIEVFFLLTGGKPYYPAAILFVFAAAGSGVPPRRRGRYSTRRLRYPAMAALTLVLIPAALPVLPLRWFAHTPYASSDEARATIGWPELAAQIRARTRDLPHGKSAVILAESYGEAAALMRFGADLPVTSGHNALWSYRRPDADVTSELVIGYDLATLKRWFTDCRQTGTVHAPYGIDNEASGEPIVICGQPRQSWSTTWNEIRHNN